MPQENGPSPAWLRLAGWPLRRLRTRFAATRADTAHALSLLADPTVVGDFANRRWYRRSVSRVEIVFDSDAGAALQAVFDRSRRSVEVLVHSRK